MNLISGHAISVADILNRLVVMFCRTIEVVQDRARMRPSNMPIVVGDAGLAHRLLGWEPKVDLSSTLAAVLDYYRGFARALAKRARLRNLFRCYAFTVTHREAAAPNCSSLKPRLVTAAGRTQVVRDQISRRKRKCVFAFKR